MTLVGSDISSVYKDLCKRLLLDGARVKIGNVETREIMSMQLQLYKPKNRFVNFKARNMSMKYCIGELCHYLDGRTDLASIAHYSKFWEKISDDDKTINSAYGYRLFKERNASGRTQFQYAMDVLRDDPSSRKAVMPIYDPDDARVTHDNPCTMFTQFMIRGRGDATQPLLLHMHVYMRSNDVWLGVPYDVAFFTIVQEVVLVYLRHKYPSLQLGCYYHNAVSMHAYERNFNDMEKLMQECGHKQVVAPDLTNDDIVTWFDDLLTYEKHKRGVVRYKNESKRTAFQEWCKSYLD